MAEIKKYLHTLDIGNNKIINLLLNPLPTSQRPTGFGIAEKGYVYYDTDDDVQYFWDGFTWIASGGGGTIPNLQQVTDVVPDGNKTTKSIYINSLFTGYGINLYGATIGTYLISDASICAAIPINGGTVITGYSPGMVLGWANGTNSILSAGGSGSLSLGSANNGGYLGTNADATGGIAAGLVEDTDSLIQAVDAGAFARGVAEGGGSITADFCGTAFGYANGVGTTISAGIGSLSIGSTEGDGSIINTGNAGFAFGYANEDTLQTIGLASLVVGRNLNNSGQYSMLFGRGLGNSISRQFIFGYLGTDTNNSKIQLDDINQYFSITIANSSFYETRLKTTNLTSHRNNEMPNADGTLALSVNGVSAGTDGSITLSIPTVIPSNVTAASTKIALAGTPTGAALQAFSIDVNEANLSLNNIGGTLGISKGGTNLTALGTANQLIRVNSGATALEYFTPTYLTSAVTSVATAGLISGGTITGTGTISTSMNTNKLVGRSTTGVGVMEEITVGSGLTLTGGTLNNTATPTPKGYYLAISDSTTQTNPTADTPRAVKFDTTDLFNGFSLQTQTAVFTGTINNGGAGAGTVLTVTGVTSGTLKVGMVLTGGSITAGTFISAFTSGTGGIGTYVVSVSQNRTSATYTGTMTSQIVVANTGIYNLQFSSQLKKSDSGEDDVNFWLRRNGADILRSAGNLSLQGNAPAYMIAAWNYVIELFENDVII